MVGEREKRSSRGPGGAWLAIIPLLSAGLGAFQLYRDDEKREFDAITFYLQNQRLFDPCDDPALANLNLRMINDRYPRVYTRIVEHVEDRSAHCDSAEHNELTPAVATTAPPPAVKKAAPAPAATGQSAAAVETEPFAAPPPEPGVDAGAFFRNRYDRLSALPTPRTRRVQEGRYRILIGIADEDDRAFASALATGLRGRGHLTPNIERTTVRLEGPQLRYYLESQRSDAERLATEIETMAAQQGAPIEVTPVYIGRDYPGLPPGVMELWLQ